MEFARTSADRSQLAGLMHAALGRNRQLRTVERLRGGSKKGVYRASLDDDFTVVVYIWDAAEDYWPASAADPVHGHADPFSHASGLDLFRAAQERLSSLGVRTPQLYLADRSQEHYPADVAVVEDVPGPTLEDLLYADPAGARPAVARLGQALDVMRSDKASGFGKVLHLSNGGVSNGSSCEQLIIDRALRDLAEVAARDARIAECESQLEETLYQKAASTRPRSDYCLIHGELGPDHVLIDREGQPVIIDIEGMMYFDIEWEHVFLRLRFGEHYAQLRRADLDQERLGLYRLAMHLSLVAGPLKLLDGDFPEREEMLEIVEYNALEVLAAVHR